MGAWRVHAGDAGVMQGMHRFVGACKINLKVYLDDAKE